MKSQSETLPPPDDHAVMLLDRNSWDPPFHVSPARPAHGGYPTPQRGNAVYAVEADEGYRAKMP